MNELTVPTEHEDCDNHLVTHTAWDTCCCLFWIVIPSILHAQVFCLAFSGENGQKILLVTIPDFSSSKTCVMLNLQSLTCHPINFSASVSMQQDKAFNEELMEL